ncbi:MAG TPA: MucR family transcriptional regulator [Allosphingosinicella sp.]|jgi:predicted transcriptional regulator
MEQQDLVTLTANIVAAHVANNNVAQGDFATLIQNVHGALTGLQQTPPQPEPERKEALVSARASVKPDYLVCMECGARQKTLKRHLATAHGLSPDQYRSDHGLPTTYPMVAPNYSEQRRALAKSLGLGRKTGPRKAGGARGGSGASGRSGSRRKGVSRA